MSIVLATNLSVSPSVTRHLFVSGYFRRHAQRDVTRYPVEFVAVRRKLRGVEVTLEIESVAIRVIGQHFLEWTNVLVVQSLEYRRCRVVHASWIDSTYAPSNVCSCICSLDTHFIWIRRTFAQVRRSSWQRRQTLQACTHTHTHVHFEGGMYSIEVIERDPGKIFDDAINEEFAHPRRILSLSCCQLQDVGFSSASNCTWSERIIIIVVVIIIITIIVIIITFCKHIFSRNHLS